MKRIVIACSAAIVAIGCLAPKQAVAGDGFAAGLFGGLAAGTILGAAASSPRVYYAEPVYAPNWLHAGSGRALWGWRMWPNET